MRINIDPETLRTEITDTDNNFSSDPEAALIPDLEADLTESSLPAPQNIRIIEQIPKVVPWASASVDIVLEVDDSIYEFPVDFEVRISQ